MDNEIDTEVNNVAKSYTHYFIKDFVKGVLSHIAASHPIDDSIVDQVIDKNLASIDFSDESFVLDSTSPGGNFIYECADYAARTFDSDVYASEDTWNEVKNLPSIHSEDIYKTIYTYATLYQRTIDVTINGVIKVDTATVVDTILSEIANRISSTETGGVIHKFNWGILSDGIWLNGALHRAYDLASIFRPGDDVVSYYSKVGFDFAKSRTAPPILEDEEKDAAFGYVDILMTHLPDQNAEYTITQNDLSNILFNFGYLSTLVDEWEQGLTENSFLVETIDTLSQYAYLLSALIETHKSLEDDIKNDKVYDRLCSVSDCVTLCLTAFQALRETKFADTLIINVIPNGEDGIVDICVNEDTLNSYIRAGGEESDIIAFGKYLHPNNGIPSPSGGWSISWATSRREDIIAEVIATEQDRIDTIRANDTAVIKSIASKHLYDIVKSYNNVSSISDPSDEVVSMIEATVFKLTGAEDPEFSLTDSVMKILARSINSSFVADMVDSIIAFSKSSEEEYSANAESLTVVKFAYDDAVKVCIG